MADSDNESGGGGGGQNATSESSPREQDRFLPIANVSRIMKKALPANAKISKDAKETVQECVSEFISFITGEASDKCQREKRKTINGDDLLWAMTTLGFEDYVEPLKVYLQKFRAMEGEKTAALGGRQDHHDQVIRDGVIDDDDDGSHVVNSSGNSGGGVVGGMYGPPGMMMVMGHQQQQYHHLHQPPPTHHHHHHQQQGQYFSGPGNNKGGSSNSTGRPR